MICCSSSCSICAAALLCIEQQQQLWRRNAGCCWIPQKYVSGLWQMLESNLWQNETDSHEFIEHQMNLRQRMYFCSIFSSSSSFVECSLLLRRSGPHSTSSSSLLPHPVCKLSPHNTWEKYTFGKYTFDKYTVEKYTLEEFFFRKVHSPPLLLLLQ